MNDCIERERIKKFFDGIYDCADLTFEPNDHCCAADDCAHCKWRETMNAIKKRILSIPAADVRPVVHTKTENALDMVRTERDRQKSLWGDQSNNHPFEWISILGEEYGELCEAVNETCFQNGTHPERGGQDKIIKEATHIAAVAVEIIEANCGTKMEES